MEMPVELSSPGEPAAGVKVMVPSPVALPAMYCKPCGSGSSKDTWVASRSDGDAGGAEQPRRARGRREGDGPVAGGAPRDVLQALRKRIVEGHLGGVQIGWRCRWS